MKLQLHRPIVFIDLETTGVNIGSDRIVEYSALKVNPDGTKEVRTERINPEMPIPANVTAIHGITNEDVKDAPTFKEIAGNLLAFIDNTDLGGYNINRFDVPLLAEEFLRAEVDFSMKGRRVVDVQNIFHQMEQRTLVAAYRFYCSKELVKAHSAEADIVATEEVLEAQLDKYPNLKNDIGFLHEFSTANRHVDLAGRIILNDKNVEVFNFGKHKGKAVEQVFGAEPSYYQWMMDGDFPRYTKKVITAIRLRTVSNKEK